MIKLIKIIFKDIWQIYRNFFHFNLSKVVIFLVGALYALVVSIPFLLISWLFYYYFNSIDIVNVFGNNIISSFLFSIFLIISFLFIFIAFSYSYILLINLNLKYIKGKKLSLKKNYYFKFGLFIKYIKLFLLNLLIIFAPFLLFIFLIFLLTISLGGISKVNEILINGPINIFSITSLILFILSLIIFIYLSYKTLFSIIILVDESKAKKFKKITYYIKKSFKLTKGKRKLFRFFIVFLLVFIASMPIVIPSNYFQKKSKNITDYIYKKTNVDNLSNKISYNYATYLENTFSKYSKKDLENEFLKYYKLDILFQILYFLFIVGLFEMALTSFYKREITK